MQLWILGILFTAIFGFCSFVFTQYGQSREENGRLKAEAVCRNDAAAAYTKGLSERQATDEKIDKLADPDLVAYMRQRGWMRD